MCSWKERLELTVIPRVVLECFGPMKKWTCEYFCGSQASLSFFPVPSSERSPSLVNLLCSFVVVLWVMSSALTSSA